jgi:hypothetical protein
MQYGFGFYFSFSVKIYNETQKAIPFSSENKMALSLGETAPQGD